MTFAVLRPQQIYGRGGKLPISKTMFWDRIVLHDPADPYIPGTRIRRLRLAKLGARAVVAFADEVDAIIDALRAARDASPLKPARPTLIPHKKKRSRAV
jgi:hypothetical protein